MEYVCIKFGVISSSSFSFRARSKVKVTRTDRSIDSHAKSQMPPGAPTDFQKLDALEGFDGNQGLVMTKHNF